MIFEDPTHSRWKTTLNVFITVSLIGILLICGLALSLAVKPSVPNLPLLVHNQKTYDHLMKQDEIRKNAAKVAGLAYSRQAKTGATHAESAAENREPIFSQKKFIYTAFVIQDDPNSINDLRNTIDQLDVVFPDWYSIRSADGRIRAKVNPELKEMLSARRVLVFPRFSNTDDRGVWHGEEFGELLKDEDATHEFTEALLAELLREHADGINIDIESIPAKARKLYVDWIDNLTTLFHRHRLHVSVDIPMNDEAFDYEAIGQIVDAVVVMAYDEHFEGGIPGPISSMNWFLDGVGEMAKRIPPRKLIVALGAYGYDWNVSSKRQANVIGFSDAMFLASEMGAEIETDKMSVNSTFSYKDDTNARHEVWFLDGVTAWNQFLVAKQNHVLGISVWRLGLEEPVIWDFLSNSESGKFRPEKLRVVQSPQAVLFKGEGELLKIQNLAGNGRRELTFDGPYVDYASYEEIPRCFMVEKFGRTANRMIALTFDDGPDPDWTPRILDILKQFNVHATFFLVGDQARRFPEIVKKELEEGHLLGNHTFLHPNIGDISETRLKYEVNMTHRVIESITDHHMVLFRPPYDTDSTPTRVKELIPLHTVSQLGYIVACADIDSEDYAKPGRVQIVKNVINKAREPGSHVVVFHDAGGDRTQTYEALAILLPLMKKEGYQFATINELIGVPQTSLMPAISLLEKSILLGDKILIYLWTWGWYAVVALFFTTTIISIIRVVFLAMVVFRSPRAQQTDRGSFTPPVLVVVPAYNEGKVIRKTLDAIIKSDYPCLSVLVVDDGSTDDTARVVSEVARACPQVRLISKTNGGKHTALNVGFEQAHEDYIVVIDADTLVSPQTIRCLIAPFENETIDAVCGNVQVGNVKNVLTSFQDVEYVTSQNYDRRAFDALNCISVVPGATGAWKRESVIRVGAYSGDTLTEDADLTLTLLERGGRIVYAPSALSTTEAPEKAKPLFKQRFRWSYGTFQCLWKHRQSLGRGNLGQIALPNMLVFQVLYPFIAPIGDLVFLLCFIRGDFKAILAGYILFLAMDLIGSLTAFALDKKNISKIVWVLFQRFYYRQFMYVVAIKALIAILKGRRYEWSKLDRSGTVGKRQDGSSPASIRE
jgi:peptidoglycan-N-acetylglucosamine deacetylase